MEIDGFQYLYSKTYNQLKLNPFISSADMVHLGF